ncbi:DNA mismatch repair endonuclease MutL [Lacticaseibacillus yichunensis]|uniref:DNA mismatch repair protein MutL n=1 Tax=Lacticaseibacillus yichunensis TaxID=2486015 RepID=A0ABW4CLP6_9LACO|nr:DNA mismatch repair endonuclease MutL [Lacticaseibacillus yichunensis]
MAKIHQLSATLSNQIAAGEVIERPASVVKELAENAIDAQATQVDITVEEAGLKLIEILDNGIGIEAEDVPTAFLRHATSKILTTRDLFNVHSLGFRGEALASIAAVADVTMTTATDNGLGTKAHLRGGKLLTTEETASRRGTQLIVRDLFFNTPARLKYVKSQNTELARIVDIVNRLAMGHPEVAFTLRHNGKMVSRTAGHGDLQQTLAGIYGVSAAKSMLFFEGEDLDFKVSGYVSLPDTTRASQQYISLMINGRYIRNYKLTHAVIDGYGSKLMVGRYPLAVIDIAMDPLLVDVNVHPTKAEVRLSKEDQLRALISQSIRERLAKENLIPDALSNLRGRTPVDMDALTRDLNAASAVHEPAAQWGQDAGAGQGAGQTSGTSNGASSESPTAPAAMPGQTGRTGQTGQTGQTAHPVPENNGDVEVESTGQPVDSSFGLGIDDLPSAPIFDHPERLAAWDAALATRTPSPAPAAASESDDDLTGVSDETAREAARVAGDTPRFPTLTYLAQVHGTYLLAEDESGLYILDQHAAQERVNYEFYRQAIGEVAADQQALLVPIVLDYPASDAALIRDHFETLAAVGIHLEDFGQNTFIIRQHPTWFKAGQEEETIKEMIDWLLRDGKLSVAAFREKTAIMMSCKRAIKANHHLDHQQAQALLTRLPDCENPFNCPHGRPVLVHFSNQDLEKMFKRIQDSHVSGGVDQ